MAVLKRFSYDNIVEHNPTAPDPVQGGGGSLNIEQVSYYNSESKTIPAGGIENVELQALYPLPFERFYTCLNYFDICNPAPGISFLVCCACVLRGQGCQILLFHTNRSF